MMRQAFTSAGFEGVTSHQFRKTVATLMDEAGFSARSVLIVRLYLQHFLMHNVMHEHYDQDRPPSVPAPERA